MTKYLYVSLAFFSLKQERILIDFFLLLLRDGTAHYQSIRVFANYTKLAIVTSDALLCEIKKSSNQIFPAVRIELGTSAILV